MRTLKWFLRLCCLVGASIMLIYLGLKPSWQPDNHMILVVILMLYAAYAPPLRFPRGVNG